MERGTSLLTLAETLVMPLRQENSLLVDVYRELFALPPPSLTVAPLDVDILEQAARLRASMPNLYLPDAIHLATAQAERCDLFLTNDSRLQTAEGIAVVLLSD